MASILEEQYGFNLWPMVQERTMHSDFPPRLCNTTCINSTNISGLSAILPLSIPNASVTNMKVANQSMATQHQSTPAKVAKKILELNMSDWLPECWRLQYESEQCCHHHHTQSIKGPINKISCGCNTMMLWWQCCQLNSTQDAIFHSLLMHNFVLSMFIIWRRMCVI